MNTTHSNAPLQDDTPRRGATTVLWLLLVLALLALAWWLLVQRGIGTDAGPAPTVVTTPDASDTAATGADRGTATARRDAGSASRARAGNSTGGSGATAAAGTREAALLAFEQPRYPATAQRRGVEGTVRLRIAVDANGVPTDIGYASRSGDPDLDRAALLAARDWRFRPATRNGRAVATTVEVPVRFTLPPTRG